MEQTAVVLASLFVDALQFIPDHAALLLHKAAKPLVFPSPRSELPSSSPCRSASG
jgi:hypothetical protein